MSGLSSDRYVPVRIGLNQSVSSSEVSGSFNSERRTRLRSCSRRGPRLCSRPSHLPTLVSVLHFALCKGESRGTYLQAFCKAFAFASLLSVSAVLLQSECGLRTSPYSDGYKMAILSCTDWFLNLYLVHHYTFVSMYMVHLCFYVLSTHLFHVLAHEWTNMY